MFYRGLMLILFCLAMAACGGGGITIKEPPDQTPPQVRLQATASVGGVSRVVSNSGATPMSMTLGEKTGTLDLVVSGKDPESGIRDLEIWMTKTKDICSISSELCSLSNPPLATEPIFKSTGPTKAPGQKTSEEATLSENLDLTQEIPQSVSAGDRMTVKFTLWAKAVNHLEGIAETPQMTVTYSETA